MKNAPRALLILTATLSLSTAAFAQTEKTDPGKKEYELQCAVCHGMDAKGDGVFNQVLKVVPPDLTVLSKKSGGVFPAERVSGVIDGRVEIASHGPRDILFGARDTRSMPLDNLSIFRMPRKPTYAPVFSG